jgi:hypothetical protein
MATSTTTTKDAPTEQLRELNERFLDAGKKVGGTWLAAYEKAALSVVEAQERAARQTDVEWLSTVLDAQAGYSRELTNLWVSTGRELIK